MPLSIVIAMKIINGEKINNRIGIAFNQGNIRSDIPNIIGNNILPNPLMNIGIIKRKVMNNPWYNIILIYCCDGI